jgi:hypothetical protein
VESSSLLFILLVQVEKQGSAGNGSSGATNKKTGCSDSAATTDKEDESGHEEVPLPA